jgi:mannose-6-phosphate isomerase-like protein (cupin superfamily)
MDTAIPAYDSAHFDTSAYVRRIDKPWGYELHWVPQDAPYMGKLIHVNAGARLSLQIHDQKQESWFIIAGKGAVIWENEQGELIETPLETGVGYTTQIGQRHRLKGITDCDIIEVSTPEAGTTWRLEDDYARKHQTPEERQSEYTKAS